MAPDLSDGQDGPVTKTAPAGPTLCRLDDIEDGEGKGFADGGRAIFVVRQGQRVHGYVNSCPHTGTPLDWAEDRFISADSGLILCATHGAQFAIADGKCLSGPCVGAYLQPVAVTVDASGWIRLA